MNILITSIGRRVQLIRQLKRIFRVIGVDASTQNAARFFVDKFFQIPRCDSENYFDEILRISKENKVDMIIPLFENEFHVLCEHRSEFEKEGIRLLLSELPIIEMFNDKYKAQEFFEKEGISIPKLTESAPAVLKPRSGMGSQGVYLVDSVAELIAAKALSDDYIIQERIEGMEYTIDVLCDFEGNVIYCVPRERSEVRAGEVSKSKINMREDITEATKYLIKKMNTYGTVIGPITVQCFLTKEEEIVFLEVNPRFGGGVPLSMEAGADYATALESMLNQKPIKINEIKNLSMYRYDMAVYVEE